MEILKWLGARTSGYNGLTVEFNPPPVLWLLLFVLAAGLVAWWSRNSTAMLSSRSRKAAVVSLRAAAVAVLFFVILDPSLVLERRIPARPRAAVLWDVSRSMNLSSGVQGSTRMDTARKWWKNAEKLRERIGKNYRAEMWTFSHDAVPAGPEAFTGGPPGTPEGEGTDILKSLKKISRGGEAPAWVMLVSDGADNSTLAEAHKKKGGVAEALEDLDFPVFAVAIGGDDEHRDIGIKKVDAPEYGFVRNAVEISVHLAARGFGGTLVPVTISENGRTVTTGDLQIDSPDGEWTMDLVFTPDHVGDFLYKVSIPQYDGEEVHENNSRVFSLKVLRDKIRLLHVVGKPSWDSRYLREALKKDPTIELISFYILREPHDSPMAPTEELSLIPFPTDELFDTKIRTFDLLIMQNFSWTPYLRRSYLRSIHDFVLEFGGGFAMVGGPEAFYGGHFEGTPIEEILPLEPVRPGRYFQRGEYHPQLTEAGSRHPITALEPDPQENRKLWDSFPSLEGYNIVGPGRPEATVLMEHPFENADGARMPLLAIWSPGRGRTMALATDTSWRWAFMRAVEGRTSEAYMKFWRAAVRWLVGDPEGKRVRARTDKLTYAPGEPVHLKVKVLDRSYAPAMDAKVKAVVTGENSSFPVENFQPQAEEFAAGMEAPPPGGWQVEVSAFDPSGNQLGADDTIFVVERLKKEFSSPWPNPNLMEEIALATGGEKWSADASPDPDALPRPKVWRVAGRKDTPLWDNWLMGGLLLALLAGEWYLRRRWGLN